MIIGTESIHNSEGEENTLGKMNFQVVIPKAYYFYFLEKE